MHTMIEHTFDELEAAGIVYCLLRDATRLDYLAQGGEIDMLVQANQLKTLKQLLWQLGYVPLPSMGYEPHHFFVRYERESDGWYKLDVVTKIVYGKSVKFLHTDLAAACLRNRQRVGPTYAPSPEDEFVTLLLHCLLDKGRFAPHRRTRLEALRHAVTQPEYVSTLLATYWLPDATFDQITGHIDAGDWDGLLAARERVTAHLKRRKPVAQAGRRREIDPGREPERALLHAGSVGVHGPVPQFRAEKARQTTGFHEIIDRPVATIPPGTLCAGTRPPGSLRPLRL